MSELLKEELFTKEKEQTTENGTKEAKTTSGAEMGENTCKSGMSHEENVEAEETETDGLATILPLLDDRIVRAIKDMGFEKLSPIQEQAIPYLLGGDDIIGQAQTGTGKTAAFGIPAIQKIDADLRKLQTIILCPTRELAIQAAEELRRLAKYMHGIKILPIYGGQDIGKQISGLRGVQIVVGTPGRVMDHMRRHTIKLDYVNMVVLDEADEMLNMGFREDMELILGEIPNEHQTALFSATMPQPIMEITKQFQKDAKLIKVAAKELTIPLVSQKYYRVKNQDKDAACIRLLEYYQPKLCLIFCNTKKKVDEVAEVLKLHGYQAEGLHGDMSQAQRDAAMNRFRNGSTSILIATDVAARGIDVDDVEAVINYDIPQDIEYYVHRIGRTGRAGRTGRSFTFVSGKEIFKIREIEKVCRTTVEEKKFPGAAKVLKAKADKYLNQAWELHEHEDMELMKKFLQRKMDEEGCDVLELAAAMLKYQVGDKAEEIEVDDYAPRRSGRFGDRRDGRSGGRRGDGRDGRFGDRRDGRGGRFGGRRGDGGAGRFGGRRGESRDERFGDGREGKGRRSEGRDERFEVGRNGRRDDGFDSRHRVDRDNRQNVIIREEAGWGGKREVQKSRFGEKGKNRSERSRKENSRKDIGSSLPKRKKIN